jgi:hypothetical protein
VKFACLSVASRGNKLVSSRSEKLSA